MSGIKAGGIAGTVSFEHLYDSLYPEIIYSFNRALISRWKAEGLGYVDQNKVAYFTASFFSSHTRTFHWVSLSRKLWDETSPESKGAIIKLKNALRDWYHNNSSCGEYSLKERRDALDALLEDLPSGRVYEEASRCIREVVVNEYPRDFSDDIEAHRTMLGLYSGYHHLAETNIEGIVYRWLSLCGNRCPGGDERLDRLLGMLTNGQALESAPFAWFKPDHACNGCQGEAPLKAWENVRNPDESSASEPPYADRPKRSASQALIEMFFQHLLGDPNGFAHSLASRRYVVLVPVYDAWKLDRGFGGIKAVILNFFQNKDQRSHWLGQKFLRLKQALPAIAAEIAATGESMAVSQPIEPPYDLLHQFLKILPFVQDWESACVVDTESGKIEYRFYRERSLAARAKREWIRAEGAGDQQPGNPSDDVMSDGSTRWCMWWTSDLWSPDLIPGLGEDERKRFERFAIRFKFPAACHVPPGDADRRFLRRAYLRQQFSLMRVLIPKVRARRAALLNAVSGIMGRNMSHNIGSHVLARYSSMIKEDLDRAHRNYADHRSEFLGYLQRRMDFLAEVATSGQAFWEQPLSLRQAIDKLNYGRQKEQIMPDPACKHGGAGGNVPILLTYISGKESLSASVEWGRPGAEGDGQGDAYFSCPGGEVGVHALYVILENVIRNSARHARGKAQGVPGLKIYVDIYDSKKDDFVEVTVIDPRTQIDKYGWVLDHLGNRVGKESLTDRLNRILTKVPILDDDGSVNPKNWGIREMQICAQYLRKESLADLEGKQEPKILEAVAWPENGTGRHFLAYRVYVRRAKLMAYVHSGEGARDDELMELGIRPISLDEVSDDQRADVISKASQGYAYLVLARDDKSVSQPTGNAFPVRTIRINAEAITDLLQKAKKSRSLEYIAELHARIIEQYCSNSQSVAGRWNAEKIFAVVAWEPPNFPSAARASPITGSLPCSSIQTFVTRLGRAEGVVPFEQLPDELPQRFNSEHDGAGEAVGLAWLDHPNEDDLLCPTGGCTRAASLPSGRAGFRRWASVEPMWSASMHKPILARMIEHDGAADVCELAAAVLARVVVLDERVQSRREEIIRGVTLFKYWPQVGVWCPMHPSDFTREKDPIDERNVSHARDDACDLDNPRFKKIQDFLTRPTKLEHQLPADFIVIHLTILEQLNRERRAIEDHSQETLNETLTSLVDGTPCNRAERIVVTGRGVPTVARYLDGDDRLEARFVPISAVQEYLVARPSKLGLMRVLWASAAPRH